MTAPPSAALAAACATLKASGLRVTRPRLAILSELVRLGQPASIEQIHRGAGTRRCDLVTVYRCMAAFEAIGLVRRAYFHNGTVLYAVDQGAPARYHVMSRTGQRLDEIDAESAAALTRALEAAEESLRARGFTATGHLVEFFATAPAAPKG